MTDLRASWQKLLTELERERDELKLKIHLAKADGRDELARLDDRIAELRVRADAASTEAKDAMGDIGEAAKKLAAEIRAGFDRVRKTF
jgi:predicted  nucleic acid-binding Zn-ribbon protein